VNFLNLCALNLRAPFGIFTVCLASWAFETTVASAGIYQWGNLNDPGAQVMFLDVEEDNGYNTSLFAPEPGSGSPTAVGNSLVLDPQNFLSQSSNGSEVVDSEFSTTLMVGLDSAIDTIMVDERLYSWRSSGGSRHGSSRRHVLLAGSRNRRRCCQFAAAKRKYDCKYWYRSQWRNLFSTELRWDYDPLGRFCRY